MDNQPDSRQLLAEIRDIQRESLALQQESLERYRTMSTVYRRTVAFCVVVVMILSAGLIFLVMQSLTFVPAK